jgi:hypothetical protein
MAEKDDEAAAWANCKGVAGAAVKFANGFLGLRKNGSDTDKLGDTDVQRFLELVRAISWVESKHGTGAGEKPKVDPMQCGNPGDVWWKELTGQLTTMDRFVRGPGLSNLDADKLPEEAASTSGFEPKAELQKLGTDVKKGHNAASFVIEHSYCWAVPILIHKTNIAASAKTYQCGGLSRSRLVTGAVKYNGGGDSDYQTKIEHALDLFGGLPVLVA